ncbi:MAG: DUF1501 domain-containing protein [Thiolinea sp.]
MNNTNLSRRRFLKGLAAAGVAVPAMNLLSNVAFAASGQASHTVVNVYLRGAMDSLSAIIPYNEAVYFDTRPNVAIPAEGRIDLDGQFALHQAMSPLHQFYQQGELAFVVATGLGVLSSTRSHFDAQRRMEAGTDNHSQPDGWLGRYLSATPGSSTVFRGVGMGRVQKSLQGYGQALGISHLEDFRLNTPAAFSNTAAAGALEQLYQGVEHSLLAGQATQTLSALDVAASRALGAVPKPAAYGTGKVGTALHQVAELINADLGLEAASVDMGGWDLHSTMGTWDAGDMRDQLSELSQSLAAFYQEIAAYRSNITIVVMSEFGRRVKQNDSGGTDHGTGGAMMVMGQGINGGRIFGNWPGLDVLDRGDLQITTDYRQVLSELMDRRLGQGHLLSQIFPDYTAANYLGIS